MIGMAIQASYRRTAPLSPRCLRITGTAPLPGGSGTIHLLSKLPPLVRFDNWPAGYGFQYFHGFLGGEASQWEPQLVCTYGLRRTPPHFRRPQLLSS